MKKITSIQFKAAFLFIVFGLNMAVGFACAVGLDDMILGDGHHGHDEVTEIHVHADGKKHVHHKEANKHPHDEKKGSKKDDCCSDKVVKLAQVDKVVPQFNTIINPAFFAALISVYYNIAVFYPSQVTTSIRYFVRSYHPPIPDIRIAIQSFQI